MEGFDSIDDQPQCGVQPAIQPQYPVRVPNYPGPNPYNPPMPASQPSVTELRGRFCCCTGNYRFIANFVIVVYIFIWVLAATAMFISLSLAGGAYWVESRKYKYFTIIPFIGATIPLFTIGLITHTGYRPEKYMMTYRLTIIISCIVFSTGMVICIVANSISRDPSFAVIFGTSIVLFCWLILNISCMVAIQSAGIYTVRIAEPVYPLQPYNAYGNYGSAQGIVYPNNRPYVGNQQVNYPQQTPGNVPMGVPMANSYNQ